VVVTLVAILKLTYLQKTPFLFGIYLGPSIALKIQFFGERNKKLLTHGSCSSSFHRTSTWFIRIIDFTK
jgi:hypothetical protein